MAINTTAYTDLIEELRHSGAVLVAVSKTKPVADIRALYDLGQRDFGENYVQELVEKQEQLPPDIRWHFIGHLQSNKVKYIAPFVHLVHGVDSYKLLQEINKQAAKCNRVIGCLLQVHIAKEETKFGLDESEVVALMQLLEANPLPHVAVKGLMGMATNTEDEEIIRGEFRSLKMLFEYCRVNTPAATRFSIISMGMSSDYPIAIEEGSTMVRIGSLLFGSRS